MKRSYSTGPPLKLTYRIYVATIPRVQLRDGTPPTPIAIERCLDIGGADVRGPGSHRFGHGSRGGAGGTHVGLVGSLLSGGVVADRLSRRGVMMGADVVRLLAQGAVAVLLISRRASVLELVVSRALLGAATGFFNPASSGLIPVIAGDRLQQAKGRPALTSHPSCWPPHPRELCPGLDRGAPGPVAGLEGVTLRSAARRGVGLGVADGTSIGTRSTKPQRYQRSPSGAKVCATSSIAASQSAPARMRRVVATAGNGAPADERQERGDEPEHPSAQPEARRHLHAEIARRDLVKATHRHQPA
jgi:hypothetical protein